LEQIVSLWRCWYLVHILEGFIFGFLSQVHKVRFHFLAVALLAQDLKVSFCVLLAIEDHAMNHAYRMMVMPLWSDAVKLQFVRG